MQQHDNCIMACIETFPYSWTDLGKTVARDVPPHGPIATVAPPQLAPQPTHLFHRHRSFHSLQVVRQLPRYAPSLLSATFTMISSGFTNAPVSQFLVFSTVIGALLATITDTRYYIHVAVVPHIWTYGQFWRFLTWQVRSRC
jgi:hypothetical protein